MAEAPTVSYAPTEELDLIRSTARQYLDDQFDSETVREFMMSDDGFDRSAWKELAGMGWLGLLVGEAHGGAGLSPTEMGVLMEEMGRSVMPGPFFASAVLATCLINEVAEDGEAADLLESLASGEIIGTVAAYETPRGWNLDDVATAATGDARVSGKKRYVLDAHMADLILVLADTGGGVGLYAVSPGDRGVTVEQVPALDPTRRIGKVRLDNVSARRIGSGDSTDAIERAIALGSALLANEQVGGCAAAMEMSVDYAKTRYQFGRPIGSYQSIKHRCANMLLKLEHAKSAAYHAVRVTDDEIEFSIAAPLAASVASEAYTWVAGENIQVHGGIGFTWEHDAHLYLKRAKASSLTLGSPQFQRHLLGEALEI